VEERLRLQMLLIQIQQLSDENWHVLARPVQAMGDHAWVGGSSPDAFGHEAARNQAEIRSQLRKALDLVQEKLQRPPLAG